MKNHSINKRSSITEALLRYPWYDKVMRSFESWLALDSTICIP